MNKKLFDVISEREILGTKKNTKDLLFNQGLISNLKLEKKLEFHEGCVNSMDFDSSGNFLLSGSDDTKLALWDVRRMRMVTSISSGHSLNIFSVAFFPYSHSSVVSGGRDHLLTEVNLETENRVLHKIHSDAVTSVRVSEENQYLIFSASEDGTIRRTDIRKKENPSDILVKKVYPSRAVYHIFFGGFQFYSMDVSGNFLLAGGNDKTLRVYDMRKSKEPCQEFLTSEPAYYITGVSFGKTNNIILANYGGNPGFAVSYDRNIHPGVENEITSEGSSLSSGGACRYSGHKNASTVKQISFFGSCNEYVLSGSDGGDMYIYNSDCGSIVATVAADSRICNVAEGSPTDCLVATSGLDDDIKLFSPINLE